MIVFYDFIIISVFSHYLPLPVPSTLRFLIQLDLDEGIQQTTSNKIISFETGLWVKTVLLKYITDIYTHLL